VAITIQELSERYPTLYHMASYGSWPNIEKYGLLSTSELLELFEYPVEQRTELLTTQRKKSVPIEHSIHGKALLRDQKSLSPENLARCLTDCDDKTWYKLLNERVFFWLDRQRLLTLMSAREYVGKEHTVLQIATAPLVQKYHYALELAHMNTGNTLPYPHKRGRSTFRPLDSYEYERRRRLSDYSAVVELTVLKGVPNVRDYVIKVEHAAVKEKAYRISETLMNNGT
jgi:hypothetical protein